MKTEGYSVAFYRTARGDSPPLWFVGQLDLKVRAKVHKWLGLLREAGPDLPRPYADIVDGPIRELRVGLGRVEVRLLYFFHERTIIIVTNGFMKKTRRIPPEEIQRAHKARTDWLLRYGGFT